MKKILIITVVVMLLLLAFASVSYAAPPASGGVYHTVRYGETLFSLGRYYGVNPYQIARENGLPNPDCIYAGQVLYIPSGHGQHGHDGGCYPNCGGRYDGQHGQDYGDRHAPQQNYDYRHAPQQNYGYRHNSQWGYDYTGYYYQHYPNYKRYSHTCGYYNNCW